MRTTNRLGRGYLLTMTAPSLDGGCACGAVRYRIVAAPKDAGYCHCSLCRRASGAPVVAFATVPFDSFQVTSGNPRRRRSSDFGERWFCAECGTQLAMHVDHQPDTIDFTIASLDKPDAVTPGFHIFLGSRIGWFDCADALERYLHFRPNTRGL
jgi:hypothetical protein